VSANRRKATAGPAWAQGKKKGQQNRAKIVVLGSIAVVVVAALIVAIVVASRTASLVPKGSAATAIVDKVSSVPAASFDQVGTGSATSVLSPVKGTALTLGGKPQVLYVGAEYCPYCAAERWAMVTALARFGTFKNLAFTHSATADVFPDTPTFTFYGSSFSSPLLEFTARELQSNVPDGNGGYKVLDTLSPDEQTAWSAIDSQHSYPFVDFGGRFAISGASYDPGLFKGKSASHIADAIRDPGTAISKAVLGTANNISAGLCLLTGLQPSSVCASAGVKPLVDQLNTASGT
jgi:thiol-disulfide isomerase/thioredoxin